MTQFIGRKSFTQTSALLLAMSMIIISTPDTAEAKWKIFNPST